MHTSSNGVTGFTVTSQLAVGGAPTFKPLPARLMLINQLPMNSAVDRPERADSDRSPMGELLALATGAVAAPFRGDDLAAIDEAAAAAVVSRSSPRIRRTDWR